MAETREIRLDVTEEDVALLIGVLELVARTKQGAQAHATYLKAKIELAWIEAEGRDEADAHNDWVNREMFGQEVEPDPDAVVRFVGGRSVVQRR